MRQGTIDPIVNAKFQGHWSVQRKRRFKTTVLVSIQYDRNPLMHYETTYQG